VRKGVIGFLAILALVGFVFIYALVFYLTLEPLNDQNATPPEGLDDPQVLSVSTGLTGLVGGVVAVALAQQQSEEQQGGQNNRNRGNWFTRRKLVSWFFDLDAKGKLATLYVLVYLLSGIAAALVWIIAGPETPNTVQALASVALGLLIPIVRAYFIPTE